MWRWVDDMQYPGGKNGAGVYHTIINLMPPHQTYIEPFLGGGAIMRQKRPALLNIGLDLDAAVIARFSDDPADIAFSGDARYQFQQGDAIEFLRAYSFTGSEHRQK